jgi:ectoine hydroxylase-related dioxygenase (phytanoyl-CoA dioxygenase family)
MNLNEAKQYLNNRGYILVENIISGSFEHEYEIEPTIDGSVYYILYSAEINYEVYGAERDVGVGEDFKFSLNGEPTIILVQKDLNKNHYDTTVFDDGNTEKFMATDIGKTCMKYVLADINKKIKDGDFADEMDAEQERLYGEE